MDPHSKLYKTSGSEDIATILEEDAAGIAESLDLNSVTKLDVKSAKAYIKEISQQGLTKRGVPEEVTIFRGGKLPKGEYTPVSFRRSTARRFAERKGEELYEFTINRSDIEADIESVLGKINAFDEAEALVPTNILRKLLLTSPKK